MPATVRRSRRLAKAIQDNRGDRCVCGRLWYAMRVLRTFTASDLMAVAEVKSRRTTRTFCHRLTRAGFLVASPRDRRKMEETTFRLARNSGPKCPGVLLQRGVVWDFNTDMEYTIR